MGAIKLTILAAVLATTLVFVNASMAEAATPVKPYIQSVSEKSYKGYTYEFFKVCSGSQTLPASYVFVSSKIDAVPIKTKAMSANQCTTYSAQIHAKSPENVKMELLTFDQLKAKKAEIQNDIKELRSKITQLEADNTKNSSKNTKFLKDGLQSIKPLKAEVKALKTKLSSLSLI